MIMDQAFANCSGLRSIVLPGSLENISDTAFSGCGCPVQQYQSGISLCNCVMATCGPTASPTAPTQAPTSLPTTTPFGTRPSHRNLPRFTITVIIVATIVVGGLLIAVVWCGRRVYQQLQASVRRTMEAEVQLVINQARVERVAQVWAIPPDDITLNTKIADDRVRGAVHWPV
eukprot:m.76057 g.76057  ORF g.76057 m.76057 type:complete len:173 (-) comp10481_c0_seq2:1194-1712(-)